MNSSLLSIVLLSCLLVMSPVLGDTFDSVCTKDFPDESNSCCKDWRTITCALDQLPAGVVHDVGLEAARVGIKQTPCASYADNLGARMPFGCYWQYRKWAVILSGSMGIMAVLIPCLVLIARKRRQRIDNMRMF